MSWNPKNCGVCGRLNRPYPTDLWYRAFHGLQAEPKWTGDDWLVRNTCEACTLSFFYFVKRSIRFDRFDVWNNGEYVYMYWMVNLFRTELRMYVEFNYFGYCENIVRGLYCRIRGHHWDIKTHKLLCGSCNPLDKFARRALREESDRRRMEMNRYYDAIEREEQKDNRLFLIAKWRRRAGKGIRKKCRLPCFPWLSLPS